MPPRALLLDFDGVIADTENHHVAAWQRTIGLMGWNASDELCARAAEIDDRAFLAEVFAARKVEGGDVEGWARRKQELTVALLTDSPRLYPGVLELVRRVREAGGVELAVVSTTWRANVHAVLEATGLAGAFALVVGKEDVKAAKPAPAAYALALKRLKVKAAQAVALEDSETGLSAAKGAGVRAVAVGHRQAEGPWTGGAPFLADLRKTDAVLRALDLLPENEGAPGTFPGRRDTSP